VIAALCAITLLAGIGTTALWEPDEPRFAEATRQMLLRKDFITPWFNDQPRFEKPVLLYWLQLPFFAVLGGTEAAARAPSVLAGFIAVLATFALLRDLVSTRAGLLAAASLATTFRFVLYARQGLTDVPVVAALTLGVWAMTRAVTRPSVWRAAYIAWVCAGAGILLKGPVGLLAPVIWTLWAWLCGGREAVRRTRPLTGIAIAAAIALPWYAVMLAVHGRAFLDVALGYEIVARYLSPEFPGRERGFFYFWGVWLGDGAPWSLFLLPAFWWAYAYRDRLLAEEIRVMQLAAVWFLTVLLVFSLSQYKLPHYILPAYPAMALGVGVFANAAIQGRMPVLLWRAPTYVAVAALIGCAVLLWLLMARVFGLQPLDASFVLPALVASGAAIVGVAASSFAGTRPLAAFSALAGTLVITYGVLGVFIAPRELRRFQPVPVLADAIRRTVPPDEPLAVAGNYGAPGLVFYTHHHVRQLNTRAELVEFLAGAGRRHCVMPESELQAVASGVHRPLRVEAQAGVFSVRMKRMLEHDPERAARVLVLVTVE
jgi:4-amino-4-deoxy-L-arabinose transferase-like glycosyltransferase